MKVTPEIWNGQGLFKTYQPNLFIDKYKEVARDVVKMHYPLLSMDEIECALDWSISRRFTDHPVKVDNNYKKQTIDMTLAGVAQYILDRQPIIHLMVLWLSVMVKYLIRSMSLSMALLRIARNSKRKCLSILRDLSSLRSIIFFSCLQRSMQMVSMD